MENKQTTFAQKQRAYERVTRQSVSILVCNYAGLNMAIEMGLDSEGSKVEKMEIRPKGQLVDLQQMVGGPMI